MLLLALIAMAVSAQQVRTLPTISAEAGSYDDCVSLECTFPEGCAGGKWWINGGELQATSYSEAVVLDQSCTFSVAGTDEDGRIITEVVSRHYDIRRVSAPTYAATPREGLRTESFYVTRLKWDHVGTAALDLAAYKEGGEHYGDPVVWLMSPQGEAISTGDANSLWQDGLNAFKIYFYKSYAPTQVGEYEVHVAPGVFVLDGKRYEEEITLRYQLGQVSSAPLFTPAEGEYEGSVEVTIDYPKDGTAFYPLYRINGARAKAYKGPITLTASATIEAYGMDEPYLNATPTTSATYTIKPAKPAPQKLDAPKVVRSGNLLTITAPKGATVKYWLGSNMSTAALYSGPIEVKENGRLSCVAYTSEAVSATTHFDVTDLTTDRGDRGELVLYSPQGLETVHLLECSPGGRFATGYVGSDTSSKGFVWDLEADEFHYASTIFVNQLWHVRSDGAAWGWRTRTTQVDESMTADDLLWGTYKDGVWHEESLEDFLKADPEAAPTLTAPEGYPAVTAVSPNGEWAILGQKYRWNVRTGEVEYLISMSERFATEARPEVLTCISDEGLIFGTYDASLFSPEKGIGMVRTLDGRWRNVADWLRDDKHITLLGDWTLSSVRAVSGDANQLLFHATPRGMGVDNVFTRAIMLSIDTQVKNLPPVALRAQQMSGMLKVKLTWKAPLTEADRVTAYRIMRGGEVLATVGGDVLAYYDETVADGTPYIYNIVAAYADGRESAPSRAAEVSVSMQSHLPVRNLDLRAIGLQGIALGWDAPIVSLPKLQYFGEENESMAFGTGQYNAEFGIRLPAADLAAYEGMQIRTFQFLPTGPQNGFTLNLYQAAADGKGYDPTPFYSQSIDPAALNYGTVNTIELTTPQPLPEGRDLYVALLIESAGNYNMLGIQYENFRSGYTDLCRIVGVHDRMVAMSANSTEATEVVLPLGIGVSTAEAFGACMVERYELSDNGILLSQTTENSVRLENVHTGAHQYAVVAVYRDGEASEPVQLSHLMALNEAALVPITPSVEVNADNSATLTWQAPRDDDRSLIHWGDLTPAKGWPTARGINTYLAIAAYPATTTAPYAHDYEITEIFYCPTSDATYELMLTDGNGDILAWALPENPQQGEINFVPLNEPISVDPSVTYQVVVGVDNAEENVAALAFDSSGKWQNGYSNILNYGLGNTTLAEILQINEHPNWLIGMVLRLKESQPLEVNGYEVVVDGARISAEITGTSALQCTTPALALGAHSAAVGVIYPAKKVEGQSVKFSVGPEGISPIASGALPLAPAATTYDIQGRQVQPKSALGLKIQNNKITLEKHHD